MPRNGDVRRRRQRGPWEATSCEAQHGPILFGGPTVTVREFLPQLDKSQAREVAGRFMEADSNPRDPLVRAAYKSLEVQSDQLLKRLIHSHPRTRVRVVYTRAEAPYTSDVEMINAVRAARVLEVMTVAADRDRPHPLLGNEVGGAYDRFRAVHDLIGHVGTRLGFDRDGEYGAWLIQDRWYTGLARLALGTELHGEHSVWWTTGKMAEHKATLIDCEALAKAHAGRSRRA